MNRNEMETPSCGFYTGSVGFKRDTHGSMYYMSVVSLSGMSPRPPMGGGIAKNV